MTLNNLLEFCEQQNASDLLLQVGQPPRVRVHGDIRAVQLPALQHGDVAGLVFDMVGERAREEFLNGERSRFFVSNDMGRYVVQLYGSVTSLSAVVTRASMKLFSLEDLGAPPALSEVADVPHGLVLINGKVGSGNAATQAAIVQRILSQEYGHVVSVGEADRSWSFALELSASRGAYSCLPVDSAARDAGMADALERFRYMDGDVLYLTTPLERLNSANLRTVLELADSGFLVLAGIGAATAPGAVEQLLWKLDHADAVAACGKIANVLRVSVCQTLAKTVDGAGRVALHEILWFDARARKALRMRDWAGLNKLLETGDRNASWPKVARRFLDAGKIDQHSCEWIAAFTKD